MPRINETRISTHAAAERDSHYYGRAMYQHVFRVKDPSGKPVLGHGISDFRDPADSTILAVYCNGLRIH